jgi:hypothetical protein
MIRLIIRGKRFRVRDRWERKYISYWTSIWPVAK